MFSQASVCARAGGLGNNIKCIMGHMVDYPTASEIW